MPPRPFHRRHLATTHEGRSSHSEFLHVSFVTGAINSPRVQVWVSRYCCPKIGLRVKRQWPLAEVDSANTSGATVRLRNGQSHAAAGVTVSGNFETGSYIITLTAGKTETLQTIPFRKEP